MIFFLLFLNKNPVYIIWTFYLELTCACNICWNCSVSLKGSKSYCCNNIVVILLLLSWVLKISFCFLDSWLPFISFSGGKTFLSINIVYALLSSQDMIDENELGKDVNNEEIFYWGCSHLSEMKVTLKLRQVSLIHLQWKLLCRYQF